MIDTDSMAERLADISGAIAAAAGEAGRDPATIALIAVSKTRDRAEIEALLELGQRRFGENRVQEAETKFAGLHDRYPDLELHLIGPLQTNKLRQAVALFDVIQTLDRPKLAEAMPAALQSAGCRTRSLLIEINTGEEPQKAGIWPEPAPAYIADCRTRLGLPVEGLMAIPPVHEEPSLHFAFLRELARRQGLKELSMGMSADFPQAIVQGATMIRVGTALFGPRPA
jgi:pyridoxal phosphate enzyme (YggS family)